MDARRGPMGPKIVRKPEIAGNSLRIFRVAHHLQLRLTPAQPGDTRIRTYNLCLVGFGNVGRAFLALLQKKQQNLRTSTGLSTA